MKLSASWRSIATRIFGSLVGVSFVCIAVSVLSLYLRSGDALRINIEQRNLEIAQQASREIARYVTDSIDELGSFGSILGPLPYSPWVQKTVLSNLSLEFRKFRWIALLGPDGKVLADSELNTPEKRLLDPDTLALVISGQAIDSQVKIAGDYTPYMIVSTPARTASGARGWLAAELHLRSIWDLVDQISVGRKKVAYLVTKDGTLIAHPDKTRVMAADGIAAVIPPPPDLTERGAVRVEKERGVDRYLTAYAAVGLLDWVVAVQQPVQDAFLPTNVLLTPIRDSPPHRHRALSGAGTFHQQGAVGALHPSPGRHPDHQQRQSRLTGSASREGRRSDTLRIRSTPWWKASRRAPRSLSNPSGSTG